MNAVHKNQIITGLTCESREEGTGASGSRTHESLDNDAEEPRYVLRKRRFAEFTRYVRKVHITQNKTL